MNFKQKLVTGAALLLGLGAAVPVLADNCGSGDRAALPICAVQSHNGSVWNGWWRIENNCQYDVTVKVDIKGGSDKRPTVAAGGDTGKRNVGAFKQVRDFYCCPRYNPCTLEEYQDELEAERKANQETHSGPYYPGEF